MYSIRKSEEEWSRELSPEQYRILRKCGTEIPGSGKYDKFYEPGKYLCAACGNELFDSSAKYSSGSGWPSFYDIISDSKVKLIEDASHGMMRTEVKCASCESHLGHVFPDGPPPTHQRYCINSLAMDFVPKEQNK